MMSQRGVTIWETQTIQTKTAERFYSDDEIRDLFPPNDGSLVSALLVRSQQAEAEIDRLREIVDRLPEDCDGTPICFGDTVECDQYGRGELGTFIVNDIVYDVGDADEPALINRDPANYRVRNVECRVIAADPTAKRLDSIGPSHVKHTPE